MESGPSPQTTPGSEATEARPPVVLESRLPPRLEAGRGQAVFVAGHWDPSLGQVTGVRLLVGGRTAPFDASRTPRPDLGHGARSGFWSTVPVQPEAGSVRFELELELPGGPERFVLGQIEVEAAAEPRPASVAPSGRASVAIAMATHEPDPALFRIQIESIRAQTHADWVCFMSDDCSSPDSLDMIERTIAGDERFVLNPGAERLGFYRNFERALKMVPEGFELIAMSDQDDRWREDKLEKLLAAIGEAVMVHSDARITDAQGRQSGPDLWSGRNVGRSDLSSLLLSNTVAGAATLFRRRLLDTILPFPEGPGLLFHDLWIGLAAAATGKIAYVDEPLYDYVQHTAAVTGNPDPESPSPGWTPTGLLRRLDRWRSAYFRVYVQAKIHAETLLARSAEQIPERKARLLRKVMTADRSVAGEIRLAGRLAKPAPGSVDTLGSESLALRGLLWKHGLALARVVPTRLWPESIGTALEPIDLDLTSTRKARHWRALRRGINE